MKSKFFIVSEGDYSNETFGIDRKMMNRGEEAYDSEEVSILPDKGLQPPCPAGFLFEPLRLDFTAALRYYNRISRFGAYSIRLSSSVG